MFYTTFLTLVFVLYGGWSLDPLCGLASLEMPWPGPEPAWSTREARFINMFVLLFLRFLFQPGGSPMFMWTL